MGVVQDAAAHVEPKADVERLFRKDDVRPWRTLTAFTGDSEIASDAVAEAFALLGRGEEVRSPERWYGGQSSRLRAVS
jgi:hypothetical protein